MQGNKPIYSLSQLQAERQIQAGVTRDPLTDDEDLQDSEDLDKTVKIVVGSDDKSPDPDALGAEEVDNDPDKTVKLPTVQDEELDETVRIDVPADVEIDKAINEDEPEPTENSGMLDETLNFPISQTNAIVRPNRVILDDKNDNSSEMPNQEDDNDAMEEEDNISEEETTTGGGNTGFTSDDDDEDKEYHVVAVEFSSPERGRSPVQEREAAKSAKKKLFKVMKTTMS